MALLTRDRLSLGSAELDDMLGGGLLKGSATLVSGAPGVGKTTLGLQYLISGITAGQTGLLVSFEEFPASVIRDAAQLGWDLNDLEKSGNLGIVFTSPQIFLESLKAQQGPIAEQIMKLQPERVVIDSTSHFQRLTTDALQLREIYNTLVNAIKRQEMTVLFLDEALNVLQTQRGRMASLPFVVDTVLLMRYVELDSTVQRVIAVMKMRGSAHQKEIRGFTIGEGGLIIGKPFADRGGILSGTAHRIA